MFVLTQSLLNSIQFLLSIQSSIDRFHEYLTWSCTLNNRIPGSILGYAALRKWISKDVHRIFAYRQSKIQELCQNGSLKWFLNFKKGIRYFDRLYPGRWFWYRRCNQNIRRNVPSQSELQQFFLHWFHHANELGVESLNPQQAYESDHSL